MAMWGLGPDQGSTQAPYVELQVLAIRPPEV